MKIVFTLLFGVASLTASPTTYHGYKLLSVKPRTHEEAQIVQHIVSSWLLDQWSWAKTPGAGVDVLVPPRLVHRFRNTLGRRHIPVTIKINDVQTLIEQQVTNHKRSHTLPRKFDHTDYHELDEIYSILDGSVADFPALLSVYSAGETYEGRDIRVVKVSTGGSKPVIWIDCGIHACEWISTATCQYFLDQLTAGYGNDSQVTTLLDSYDFHIMPCTNPDGYVYTWTVDRLWRKNRVPNILCHGVDCNRNFDSDFGGAGSSNNPCSDYYSGESAFSERESQAVRGSIEALPDVRMYFSLHSYAQLWLTSYGYTEQLPANYDEQYRVAGVSVRALEAVHGTKYNYGNIADVIYLAAGSSADWVYDSAKVQYSYGIELRDEGDYGYLLPPEQILPTAEETWAGIIAGINAI
ncbi:carboxypeptidase B isoform X2 [Cherax quadricarinatus]|uniref:carboxypeptidase B isoform X2 n=1 Tax=Cherax quadricarinatus TaxID=27406 RepID=UPI00387EC2FE